VEPEETFIARKRLGKHVLAATNTQATMEVLLGAMFSTRSVKSGYKRREMKFGSAIPCGGGVEYLHCDPASRRRR
jgi:hypothetical protein